MHSTMSHLEKMTRKPTARRSFSELEEHRKRRGKHNKTKHQARQEWI